MKNYFYIPNVSQQTTIDVPGLKPGMKLEAVDRNNPPSFCVATLLSYNRLGTGCAYVRMALEKTAATTAGATSKQKSSILLDGVHRMATLSNHLKVCGFDEIYMLCYVGKFCLMVSMLDCGSKGPGSRSFWVLAGSLSCVPRFSNYRARHLTLTVPLSTQDYKWVPANCQGNLTKY